MCNLATNLIQFRRLNVWDTFETRSGQLGIKVDRNKMVEYSFANDGVPVITGLSYDPGDFEVIHTGYAKLTLDMFDDQDGFPFPEHLG